MRASVDLGKRQSPSKHRGNNFNLNFAKKGVGAPRIIVAQLIRRDSLPMPVSDRICKHFVKVVPPNRNSSPYGYQDSQQNKRSSFFDRSRDSIGADALHERISDLKVRDISSSTLDENYAFSPKLQSPRDG